MRMPEPKSAPSPFQILEEKRELEVEKTRAKSRLKRRPTKSDE
jgi:hypothetical protein